jgi:hypothetical protein
MVRRRIAGRNRATSTENGIRKSHIKRCGQVTEPSTSSTQHRVRKIWSPKVVKINGHEQIKLDEVGEIPLVNTKLIKAACNHFFVTNGMRQYEFNRYNYERKKRKKKQVAKAGH